MFLLELRWELVWDGVGGGVVVALGRKVAARAEGKVGGDLEDDIDDISQEQVGAEEEVFERAGVS